MEYKDILLKNIGFSNRTYNALWRAGIKTIEDLLSVDKESFMEIRGLGAKSVDEIQKKIEFFQTSVDNEIELSFASNEEDPLAGFGFSVRTSNCLRKAGVEKIEQIMALTRADLYSINGMGELSANEVIRFQMMASELNEYDIVRKLSIGSFTFLEEDKERIIEYVRANDVSIQFLGLNNKAINILSKIDRLMISEIIFVTSDELESIRGIGKNTVDNIMAAIENYMTEHGEMIEAYCRGDKSQIISDSAIKTRIMSLYKPIAFSGLTLEEISEGVNMAELGIQRIKNCIGMLLMEGELEYTDYRLYRKYPSFLNALALVLKDREYSTITQRAMGKTLEEIGKNLDITRERVRQIEKKALNKVTSGAEVFDEDYYRYLYTTYAPDRDMYEEWLGVSPECWYYLGAVYGDDKGTAPVENALQDNLIEAGLKLRIANYIHRNQINAGGKWINRNKSDIEDYVLMRFCRDEVSFDEFVLIYTEFICEIGMENDKSIAYTKDVIRTRENRLADSRCVLWKRGRRLRYYDIDGGDYEELLDTLNLDEYMDVELSTLKFMKMYPAIMDKYDIRDQYELHNLLKKILPENENIRFNKMPNILFGEFDRASAMKEIILANAPVSQNDFVNIVHEEYGYDKGTIMGTYSQCVQMYLHNGEYTIETRIMSDENRKAFEEHLNDDYYTLDELKRIYLQTVPTCNTDEINPYNLKKMGFSVYTICALRNYQSLESYFTAMLTQGDFVDVAPLTKRFTNNKSWWSVYSALRNSREIVEYAPGKIVNRTRLEKGGITEEVINRYCDNVYQFVSDDTYFSVQSIRHEGFDDEIYDTGFDDWFYASLLRSDNRFSSSSLFGCIILHKGRKSVTRKSLILDYVERRRSADVTDIVNDLKEIYGCCNTSRSDVLQQIYDTNLYWDDILDCVYINESEYRDEVERDMEVF